MLFSLAEGHVENGDFDEALKAGNDCLSLFRKAGDDTAVADSVRVVCSAYRLKAEDCMARGDARSKDNCIKDAEGLVEEQLANYKEKTDKRGEGMMLLTLGELSLEKNGLDARDLAVTHGEEALRLFREVSDQALEGQAQLMLLNANFKKGLFNKARDAASAAVAGYQDAEDKRGEAEALTGLAKSDQMMGSFDAAMKSAKKALALLREVRDEKGVAMQLLCIAEWHIAREEFAKALPLAKEAHSLMRANGGAIWEASALGCLSEVMIAMQQSKEALKLVQDTAERMSSGDDKKEGLRVAYHVVFAQLANGANDDALTAAQQLVDDCKDEGNKLWEARAYELVAYVQARMGDLDKAIESAEEAVTIYHDLEAEREEAICRIHALAKYQAEKGDGDGAAKSVKKARALAAEMDDLILEGYVFLASVDTFGMVNQAEKAVDAGLDAADCFREAGDKRGEGKAQAALANIYIQFGNFDEAVRQANASANTFASIGDRRGQARGLLTVATAHYTYGNPTEAAKVAQDGLKLCRSEDDKKGAVHMLFMMLEANVQLLGEKAEGEDGSVAALKSGCDKALRMAKEAAGIAVKAGDKSLEAGGYYWMAQLHVMMGASPDGLASASQAKALFRKANDKKGEVRTMALEAQVHMFARNNGEASKLLQEALLLAEECGDKGGEASVKQLLEEIQGQQAQMVAAMPVMQAGPVVQAAASEAQAVAEFKPPDPDRVKGQIQAMVNGLLGSDEVIDSDTPLMESGIDSLASVELRTGLTQTFGVPLPSTVMFNYPTVGGLTMMLVDELTAKKISWGR